MRKTKPTKADLRIVMVREEPRGEVTYLTIYLVHKLPLGSGKLVIDLPTDYVAEIRRTTGKESLKEAVAAWIGYPIAEGHLVA